MKMRFSGLIAVVMLTASQAAISQSSINANDNSQNSTDCSDPTTAMSDACMGRGQQNLQQASPGNVPSTGPRSLGAQNPETTSQTGQQNGRLTQQTQSLPPEPPTEFQKFVAATTGQVLPIYGANLFRNVPTTFAPVDFAPVTADYIIGPEDELRVRIWGQINYNNNLRVDRSGDVYLPQIGTVHVAGLQFAELDQHLRAAVARDYRNFDLAVDMGRIRSIQVYVTGQARRPGVYTVSSLSTLVNALFASGGPSAEGSLRHIQLKREGKTVADFDLYSLLIRGDKSKDVRLQSEDVLYIPPAGPRVAITGSIRYPAIYELIEGETLRNLIDAAGQTDTVASNTRISLERVEQQQNLQAMEFKFDDAGLATPVKDGDIVRISAIVPAYRKTVTLRGDVANPGRFSWRPGLHVSDLIPDRDSLLSRDYWWNRSHLGLPGPEFEPMISALGQDPRTLEMTSRGFTTAVSQDTLTSALKRQATEQNQNTQQPNLYNQPQQNQYNYPQPNVDNNTYNNNLQQYPDNSNLQQNNLDNPNLQNQNLNAMQPNNQRQGQSGGIGSLGSQTTEPRNPGTWKRERNEVRMSAPEIDWDFAVIERLDPNTLKTSLIPFELGKLIMEHDASQDLPLEAGDTITIFSQDDIKVPLEKQTKYVTLEGEFVHGGVYSVKPGETLRDVARRAGGLTSKAYLYGSELTRESTRVFQQQRIDEYVRSVGIAADHGVQALTVSGTSNGPTDVAGTRLIEQELIARLSQVRATGRVVLQLTPTSKSLDDLPAIDLENGDHFVVPAMPATVNIVGAVYDQNSFLYRQGWTVGHYLRLAGGANRDADQAHAFVIHADGSVIDRAQAKSGWGNTFEKLQVNPGDTVVVPDKTLRPSALRAILDYTQIFSQLAFGAASLSILP